MGNTFWGIELMKDRIKGGIIMRAGLDLCAFRRMTEDNEIVIIDDYIDRLVNNNVPELNKLKHCLQMDNEGGCFIVWKCTQYKIMIKVPGTDTIDTLLLEDNRGNKFHREYPGGEIFCRIPNRVNYIIYELIKLIMGIKEEGDYLE